MQTYILIQIVNRDRVFETINQWEKYYGNMILTSEESIKDNTSNIRV